MLGSSQIGQLFNAIILINGYAWKDQYFASISSKSDNLCVHESSQGSSIWLIVSGLGKVYHYILNSFK